MTNTQLSPELQLILAACRLFISKHETSRQQAYELCQQLITTSALDWQTFLEKNAYHKVQPLVFQGLSQANLLKMMPDEVQQTLEEQARQSVQITMTQTAELIRLQRRFVTAGIFMLPLKGVVLSQRLFGQVSIRSAGDLDLWVSAADFDLAGQLLQDAGYTLIEPDFPLTPKQQQIYRQARHHYGYHHPANPYYLELHWKLSNGDLLFGTQTMQAMLDRLIDIPIGTAKLPCFSDQDLLHYLSLHGATHHWFRLKWLCDLGVLLQQPDQFDWNAWQKENQTQAIPYEVHEGVMLAHQLLDVPLPNQASLFKGATMPQQTIIEAVCEDYVHYLSASRQVWATKYRLKPAHVYSLISRFAVSTNLKQKWSAFWQLWIEPDDWRDFPLPDRLFPLYFVLRPFFWLWRYHVPSAIRGVIQKDSPKALS